MESLNQDKKSNLFAKPSAERPPLLKAFQLSGWEFTEDNTEDQDIESETRSEKVGSRVKTSLRLKYEAEVKIMKSKVGGLEEIRLQLGLSQRKICQLLLVDPSAWSRWTKSGEDAPPHIYRMLTWYLAMTDKYPALEPGFWLSTVARIREPIAGHEVLQKNQVRIEELETQLLSLHKELDGYKKDSQEIFLQLERARDRELKVQRNWFIFGSILISGIAGASYFFLSL